MPYLPPDEFHGREQPNFDLAADYLELKAVLSRDGLSFSQDIVDALELSDDGDSDDLGTGELAEDAAAGAVGRMISRLNVLQDAYPFRIDDGGDAVILNAGELNEGQIAYLACLVLSNLRAVSPLLDRSIHHPSEAEIRDLRRHFQCIATAAIAAEVGGPAWSFGFPRSDGTGFLAKLSDIWASLKDGNVQAASFASRLPKDDQVDIFAWREHRDGLPGFLLVAAQVATGKGWKSKSIRNHVEHVFPHRWFKTPPATKMVAYHVIPFARPDDKFPDDVLVLGNILHRLRVPLRVMEAASLVRSGVKVENFDKLAGAAGWVASYMARARGP